MGCILRRPAPAPVARQKRAGDAVRVTSDEALQVTNEPVRTSWHSTMR